MVIWNWETDVCHFEILTFAFESLFSEINNIKNSNRDQFSNDSSFSRILLKVTKYEFY